MGAFYDALSKGVTKFHNFTNSSFWGITLNLSVGPPSIGAYLYSVYVSGSTPPDPPPPPGPSLVRNYFRGSLRRIAKSESVVPSNDDFCGNKNGYKKFERKYLLVNSPGTLMTLAGKENEEE